MNETRSGNIAVKMPTCLPTSSDGSNSIPQVLPHSDEISIENDPGTPSFSQIKWRCRRGTLELDMWLMRYVDTCFKQATSQERQLFSTLLDLPDPELWAYLIGQRTLAEPNLDALINRIRAL